MKYSILAFRRKRGKQKKDAKYSGMMVSNLIGKKVLIGEDDPVNQYILKHMLNKLRMEHDVAGNGKEVIEKFSIDKYDIVLMDIQMPLMNGLDAARHIRQHFKSSIPIIAITAFSNDAELQQCMDAGMTGYLSKPFTIDSLSMIMEKGMTEKNKKHTLRGFGVEVDMALVYEVSANDENYIRLMVETFLKNMPVTILKIKETFAAQDWDALYKAAHLAKSSLSVIQVGNSLDWVKQIETNSRTQNNLDQLDELVKNIDEQVGQAAQLLTQTYQIKTAGGKVAI